MSNVTYDKQFRDYGANTFSFCTWQIKLCLYSIGYQWMLRLLLSQGFLKVLDIPAPSWGVYAIRCQNSYTIPAGRNRMQKCSTIIAGETTYPCCVIERC